MIVDQQARMDWICLRDSQGRFLLLRLVFLLLRIEPLFRLLVGRGAGAIAPEAEPCHVEGVRFRAAPLATYIESVIGGVLAMQEQTRGQRSVARTTTDPLRCR
jgi:hypothetical protein